VYQSRKYLLNECLFDSINSEDAAYAFGLFITDGCFRKDGIAFSSKDYEQISLFKSLFESEAPIRKRIKNNNIYYEITLSSKHLAETVLKLRGESKKENGDFSFIPEQYIHHFIRGVFDGDGCIRIKNKNKETPQLSFDICGTYELLHDIKRYIDIGISKKSQTTITEHGNIYRITYSGNRQCSKIYNYLYHDATRYLSRKKEWFNNA
jgi:hypothetical protein